ncbi:hypothetical protein MnTg03_01413 [bacterium MnTg03]|nr:hypothetical protein MnTg03_01413 [bacterium MnTg03]
MVWALGKQPCSCLFRVYLTIDIKSLICPRLAGNLATVRIEFFPLSGTIKMAECTPGMKLQSVASHCCENFWFINLLAVILALMAEHGAAIKYPILSQHGR